MISRLSDVFTSSVRRKLFSTFTLLATLVLLVVAVGYYELDQLRSMSRRFGPKSTQTSFQQDFALALNSLDTDLETFFLVGDVEHQEAVFNDLKDMTRALDAMNEIGDKDARPALIALESGITNVNAQITALVQRDSDKLTARESNEIAISVYDQIDTMRQVHKEFTATTLDQLQNAADEQQTIISRVIVQFMALSVFIFVLAMAGSVLISRSIAAPITDVAHAAAQIAGGDLRVKVPVRSKDEIGALAQTFNTMAAAIQQREQDLKAAQRIANENSRLKSEFLATMSHELRTPLNAVEGFTSIMLAGMGIELESKARIMVERIQVNSKRLLQLINDFLDLSRIESGRMELVSEPLSPVNLAHKWETDIAGLAEKKNLAFQVEIDPGLPDVVYGDEEALSKIAINLLGNAVKFTREGRVTLALKKNEDTWAIVVSDTGIGIPLHAREFIFEEFRQVDGSSKREYGGTGLGLAIVNKLTRTMGGNVTLTSEVGQGSTFTVTLPLQDSHN